LPAGAKRRRIAPEAFMPERRFDPQALALDTELAGRRLPSPGRRLTAFGLDLVLLLLPTVAAAVLFAALALRWTDPRGFAALRSAVLAMPDEAAARHAVVRDLVPLLARLDGVGLPPAVRAEVAWG
jgi:hypothetical protein